MELRSAPNLHLPHLSEIRDTFDILQSCRRLGFDTPLIRVMNQVLQRFHAEIMHSPPVTMLHTFTCSVCGERGELREADTRSKRVGGRTGAHSDLYERRCAAKRNCLSMYREAKHPYSGGLLDAAPDLGCAPS